MMALPAGMESMEPRVPMVNRGGMVSMVPLALPATMERTVLMGLRAVMERMVPKVTRVTRATMVQTEPMETKAIPARPLFQPTRGTSPSWVQMAF